MYSEGVAEMSDTCARQQEAAESRDEDQKVESQVRMETKHERWLSTAANDELLLTVIWSQEWKHPTKSAVDRFHTTPFSKYHNVSQCVL